MNPKELMLALFALVSLPVLAQSTEVPTGPDLMKVCGSQSDSPMLEIVMRRYGASYVYLDMTVSHVGPKQFERKIGYVYDQGPDFMRIAIGHVEKGRFVMEKGQALNLETVGGGSTVRGKIFYKNIADDVTCFLNFS